ncbi:MAG: class I SAM-dependent methyltransferase [Alphaproteobacteria bacterium]|nr:class I SAM-dependent methyltransferase [Alphaproteobacteria bacterium]
MPDKDLYKLPLSDADWNGIFAELKKNRHLLFLHPEWRLLIAKRRAAYFGHQAMIDALLDTSISYTLDWNSKQMDGFVEGNFRRLVFPLYAIDFVWLNAPGLHVLSIGPRNEMELYLLYALRFRPDRVKAVDLISNSPLVDIADMHALPFDDNSFDVVISSWTLPYSKQPRRAAHEVARVCRHNGLVAIGLTRVPSSDPEHAQIVREGAVPFQTVDEIVELFSGITPDIVFRHEPVVKTEKGALMVIFRVTKH